jgi:hypothetical protein
MIVGGQFHMLAISESSFQKLPPLYAQDKQEDPIVYVKLIAGESEWAGYITEGALRGEEIMVFGVFGPFLPPGTEMVWQEVSLSGLQKLLRDQGLELREEISFVPARLTAVIGLRRIRGKSVPVSH